VNAPVIEPSADPSAPEETAGVPVAPPILYFGALALAIGLQALSPIAPMPEMLGKVGGGLLVALASILGGACLIRFRRAGTAIPTYRPTTTLVADGPYRYSRNPIYVSLTTLYLGLTLLAGSWWGPILLPLVIAVVRYAVIAREEAYLERKFGDAYRDYRSRVRRWI
jgi:protein-S-isoprenylcysteine O-methyltransferase Ste14